MPYKAKYRPTMQSSNYAPWYYALNELKIASSEKLVHRYFGIFIDNCQNFEETQMYFNRWIDIKTVAYSYMNIIQQ